MDGQNFLLGLLGAIALLIWSIRMVKTGILRAFGEHLRGILARASANRVQACGVGAVAAAALQSSAAVGLLVAGFADRRIIALVPALAIMLGADIGSTLAVQALSFNLAALVPLLLLIGVSMFMGFDRPVPKQIGRIIIGLALMLVALGMIKATAAPLRDSPLMAMVMQRLATDPITALALGALVAWLMHSSVAAILLILSLVGAGGLPVMAAAALILGCNVGSALIPIGLALRSPLEGRRVLVGNLVFRFAGAALVLLVLPQAIALTSQFSSDPVRMLANFHTAFNVAVALLWLPLLGPAARALTLLLPDAPITGARQIGHLDESLLDRPQLALSAAGREVLRMAERVEIMLRDAIVAFNDGSGRTREEIKAIDDDVDRTQEEVKLYLTRLTRQALSDADSRKAFDLILFTTNLEHVGDILDKSLLELAAKKQRLKVEFSPEGWDEIRFMHKRVVEQLRLATTVFMTGDLKMARELVAEKDNIRLAEREAMENHLRRLREGTLASIETSALHLDILRDLKRINAHIVAIAYPSLEASGDLRTSRLRAKAAA